MDTALKTYEDYKIRKDSDVPAPPKLWVQVSENLEAEPAAHDERISSITVGGENEL